VVILLLHTRSLREGWIGSRSSTRSSPLEALLKGSKKWAFAGDYFA